MIRNHNKEKIFLKYYLCILCLASVAIVSCENNLSINSADALVSKYFKGPITRRYPGFKIPNGSSQYGLDESQKRSDYEKLQLAGFISTVAGPSGSKHLTFNDKAKPFIKIETNDKDVLIIATLAEIDSIKIESVSGSYERSGFKGVKFCDVHFIAKFTPTTMGEILLSKGELNPRVRGIFRSTKGGWVVEGFIY